MAKTAVSSSINETQDVADPQPVQQQASTAITPWKKPKNVASLAIPEYWERNPQCGEYLTTLDEGDKAQARQLALALSGKTTSGKNAINRRLKVVGITCCPFLSAKDEAGNQSSKVGFHLHTMSETIFVAHYHARQDILALVSRFGLPSIKSPIECVIDPVQEANTYRVLAGDLVE